jgi:hypothetical protein
MNRYATLRRRAKSLCILTSIALGFLAAFFWPQYISSFNKLPPDQALDEFAGEYRQGVFWVYALSIERDMNFSLVVQTDLGSVYQYTGIVSIAGNSLHLSPSTEPFFEQYEYLPIRFDDRRYLIEANRIAEFCEAVKDGQEPPVEHSFVLYYLRKGDEVKPVNAEPIRLDGRKACPEN